MERRLSSWRDIRNQEKAATCRHSKAKRVIVVVNNDGNLYSTAVSPVNETDRVGKKRSGQVKGQRSGRGRGAGVYESRDVAAVQFILADYRPSTHHHLALLVLRRIHRGQAGYVDGQIVGLHIRLEHRGGGLGRGTGGWKPGLGVAGPAGYVHAGRRAGAGRWYYHSVYYVEEPTSPQPSEGNYEQYDHCHGDDDRPADEHRRDNAQTRLGARDVALLTVVGIL